MRVELSASDSWVGDNPLSMEFTSDRILMQNTITTTGSYRALFSWKIATPGRHKNAVIRP